MDPTVLSVVQMRSIIGDTDRNLDTILAFADLAVSDGADMICFPEASLTGYTTKDPGHYAIGDDDDRIGIITDYAKDNLIDITFGYIEASDGRPFICHRIVSSDGRSMKYRKTHLGDVEKDSFGKGTDIPVMHLKKAIVGVHLCWEAHIPEISSTLRHRSAELILIPHCSGLGGPERLRSWEKILPARASDNGVFVAACNSVIERSDGSICGGGCMIVDPHGDVVKSCYGDSGSMITAKLDGRLPRDSKGHSMREISYFDRRDRGLYDLF